MPSLVNNSFVVARSRVGSWSLLFTIYCRPISAIFVKLCRKYHLYADDTQLYVEFPRSQPCEIEVTIRRTDRCTTDVKRRVTDHHLMLNEAKTETTVLCTPYCKAPPTVNTIYVCGFDISPQSFLRDLGVFMDSTLYMSTQVACACIFYCTTSQQFLNS